MSWRIRKAVLGIGITSLAISLLISNRPQPEFPADPARASGERRNEIRFTDLPRSSPPRPDESLAQPVSDARHRVSPMAPASATGENQGVRFHAFNPAQSMVARFHGDRVELAPPGSAPGWRVELSRRGTGAAWIETEDNRVTYRHGDGVVEWWDNEDAGIRQNFLVPDRVQQDGKVRLGVQVRGMAAATTGSPDALAFHTPDGTPVLRYDGLQAWDADGRTLDARMETVAGGFELVAVTEGARFPITIDPLVHRFVTTLVPPITGTGISNGGFGPYFAHDGQHLVVYAPAEGPDRNGWLHFFGKNAAGEWQLAGRLLPSLTSGNPSGLSIAGNLAVLGFPHHEASLVFERVGGVWKETATIKAPASLVQGHSFGASALVTPHGILIGCPADVNWSGGFAVPGGSVLAYRKSKNAWVAAGSITPANPADKRFGTSLAGDGSIIAVSSLQLTSTLPQAVGVFRWSGGSWLEEAELVAPAGSANAGFGTSVDVDDQTIVIGITQNASGANGAVAIFEFDNSEWKEVQRIPKPFLGVAGFGRDLDLGGDLLAVEYMMGTYVYRRSPTGFWEPLSNTTVAPGTGWHIYGASNPNVDGDRVLTKAGADSTPGPEQLGAGQIEIRSMLDPDLPIVQRLDSGDSGHGNQFGSLLATDGNRVLVCASYDYNPSTRSFGRVYACRRAGTTWVVEGELAPPSSPTGRTFGASLGVHGDTAIVGDTGSYPINGQVHFFEFSQNGWEHRSQFSRQDGLTTFDHATLFGSAVAIHGDFALVGDPAAQPTPFMSNEGMILAYRRTNGIWAPDGRLEFPGGQAHLQLGRALALQSGRAFAGANGSVEVFEIEPAGWTWKSSLVPLPGSFASNFGTALAASGNTLAVAAPSDSSGSVHLFHEGAAGWALQQSISVDSFDPQLRFGSGFARSIALSGDLCLVGAPGILLPENADWGAVLTYSRSGTMWNAEPPLPFSVGAGEVVALGGGSAFQGLPRAVVNIPWNRPVDAGKVEVHQITTPCPRVTVAANGKNLKPGATTSFPKTAVGETGETEFIFRNAGLPLVADVRWVCSGPDKERFSVEIPAVHELLPGEETAVRVRFSPAGPGTHRATLMFLSNACAGPVVIPLTATAIANPEIEVAREGYGPLTDGQGVADFGDTGSGDVAFTTFRVHNSGLVPLLKLSLKATGPAAKDYRIPKLPKSLAAGDALDFTVEFRPSTAGTRLATLQILSSDPDESPFDIPLTGTGIARPEIEVKLGKTPLNSGESTLDFGTVAAGKTLIRKIQVSNSGWLSLDGLAVGIDGDSAFTATTALPSTLAPGKSATLSIAFRSSGPTATGAMLRISSNDADEQPFEIQLRAGSPAATISARAADTAGGDSSPAEDAALIALAFGLDSTSPGPGGSNGCLPVIRPVERDGRRWIRFEYIRRSDDSLDYEPQLSRDLVSFSRAEGMESVTVVDRHWNKIVLEVEMPEDAARQGFGRIKVTRR